MAFGLVRRSITITLSKDCIEWLDREVQQRIYHNRSNAIEVLVLETMKEKSEARKRLLQVDKEWNINEKYGRI